MTSKKGIALLVIILLTIGILLISLNGRKELKGIEKQNKESQIEEAENEKIRVTCEIEEKIGSNKKILIKVKAEDGIKEIHTPEPDVIYVYGEKEIAIDYTAEFYVEYKFIIISETGEEKEEIVCIEPEIKITNLIIGKENSGYKVENNSQIVGTELFIRFKAILEGTECTITPEVPYKITQNGKYKFKLTGTYNEKIIQKEVEIEVWKYQVMGGFVKYDAGDWTKEEIDELKNQKLYDVNKSKEFDYNSAFKLEDDSGKGFTFGGFTYKEDYENEKEIQEEIVVTSRNQSTSSKDSNRN